MGKIFDGIKRSTYFPPSRFLISYLRSVFLPVSIELETRKILDEMKESIWFRAVFRFHICDPFFSK